VWDVLLTMHSLMPEAMHSNREDVICTAYCVELLVVVTMTIQRCCSHSWAEIVPTLLHRIPPAKVPDPLRLLCMARPFHLRRNRLHLGAQSHAR
jgi:hypothetical protein